MMEPEQHRLEPSFVESGVLFFFLLCFFSSARLQKQCDVADGVTAAVFTLANERASCQINWQNTASADRMGTILAVVLNMWRCGFKACCTTTTGILNHVFDEIIAITPTLRVWCCKKKKSRFFFFFPPPPHLFSLKAVSIPGRDTLPVHRWALCGLQRPDVHGDGRARVEERRPRQTRGPQFVCLLCIVRIIPSESKAEDDGGSCCQSGSWADGVQHDVWREAVFLWRSQPTLLPVNELPKGYMSRDAAIEGRPRRWMWRILPYLSRKGLHC